MAAGDIILSNGTTITAAEIQQIAAEVKKELAAESKELSQFEEVTSLANVSSLPGIQQSGATKKLVRVALEVLKGVDGKNIELTASQTAIQWRNVGDSAWNTLVDLSLLKGSKGDKGDKGDTGEKGDTGDTGATGAKGDPGEKVMLQKGASGIEWKYEDDASWQTLIPMADLSFTFEELTDEQKQEISRRPILGTVSATKGDTPSGSFTEYGTDDHGNPKYKLNLVLPKGDKGDKGEPPIFEIGTTTTGLPETEASVEVVSNGQTEQGNPKYLLNFTIPAGKPGQDGTGSGNVYVAETGLVSGKKYLFQPGANNSANGTFVEYTEPTIPEQVQPDWNATEGKGAILNKPTILPDAPKDGKQYARKDGTWEEVEAGDELSKDAIEQALTGNITTHRHDTTYNYTDFETDVWDGTSISTSLQGSGTKDDPYLIQSCADWLHLFVNGLGSYNTQKEAAAPTEFSPVFKLNKNLDFGNKTIPDMNIGSNPEDVMGVFCEFDGCGARISNFVSPVMENIATMSIGVFPFLYVSFVHDFVIDNAQLDVTLTSDGGDLSIFSLPSYGVYVISLNNIIRVKANISGSIGENEIKMVMSHLSTMNALGMAPSLKTFIDNYLEENGYFLGVDIEVTDSTVKGSNGKLFVYNQITNDTPITIFSSTPMTEIEIGNEEPVFEGDYAISIIVSGQQPAAFYANSDGASKIHFETYGVVSTFTGTPKSLTEMQSAAFVDELNSHLPKPAFRQDPDGGTPILAGGNATIAYDGYVKKSEFEAFKAKLSVNTPVEGSPFVDIEMASSNFPTDNDTVELTPEQYSIIDGGLKEGKMLRIKAKCGIFFGSTTTLIPFDASGDITPDKMEPSVLIWSTSSSLGIGSAHVKAVQMSVYISHTPNEAGNYVATFYKMKGDFVLSEEITTIKKLTQSEYDGLSSKDSKTLYVIVG